MARQTRCPVGTPVGPRGTRQVGDLFAQRVANAAILAMTPTHAERVALGLTHVT